MVTLLEDRVLGFEDLLALLRRREIARPRLAKNSAYLELSRPAFPYLIETQRQARPVRGLAAEQVEHGLRIDRHHAGESTAFRERCP